MRLGLSLALGRYARAGAAGAGVSITDSFTRADSAVSLGTTTTGAKVWSALSGVWGVLSNQAYVATTGTEPVAVIDAGVADCTVSVVCRPTVGKQGLAFRVVDISNFWRTVALGGNLYLQKTVATVLTDAPGSPIAQALADGDTLSVVLSGTSIIVKVNGVTKYSITDSQFQTATKHGLAEAVSGDTAAKFDDFSVTA